MYYRRFPYVPPMHPAAGGARPVQMVLKRNGKSLDKGNCFRIQCLQVRGWPTLWNHKLSDICHSVMTNL